MLYDKDAWLNCTYPDAVNKARATITQDMVNYVLRGVKHRYEHTMKLKGAKSFSNDVGARLHEHLSRQLTIPKHHQAPSETVDTLAALIENARKFRNTDTIAIPNLSDEKLYKQLATKLGVEQLEFYGKIDPSVRGAYNAAKKNFIQNATRVTCVTVIHEMVRFSRYSNVEPLAGSDDILNELYSRSDSYMRNILIFGGLLGGVSAKEAVQLVAKQVCHRTDDSIRFSVMEFLSEDGRHPGSYPAAEDEQLRADIKRCYDELA